MADILIYGEIYNYSVQAFFEQIKDAREENPDEVLKLRINCNGGNPDYAMGMIAKCRELENYDAIVEGKAHSMALFLLCYLKRDHVSAIDTAHAILHRAAYDPWLEQREGFKDSMFFKILEKNNKDLEKAFRAAVNVEVLEALPQFKEKGIKLKDIFAMDDRKEVHLTAKDLKAIGLVNEIIRVTPRKMTEIESAATMFNNVDSYETYLAAARVSGSDADNKTKDQQKSNTMTLDELKAQFPAVYAAAKQEGASEEKDRVEAFMVFAEVDPTAVKSGIESGKPMSTKQLAEFSKKAAQAGAAASTTTEEETPEQKEALAAIAGASAKTIETSAAAVKTEGDNADPVKAEEDRLDKLRAEILDKYKKENAAA